MFVFPLTLAHTLAINGTIVVGLVVYLVSRRVYWLLPVSIFIIGLPFHFLSTYGLINYQQAWYGVGPFLGGSIVAMVALLFSSYTTLRRLITGR